MIAVYPAEVKFELAGFGFKWPRKGAMPVVQIDDTVVDAGTVGSNTRKVMELFENYTKKEIG